MSRTRLAFALLALVALMATLAACGGDDDSGASLTPVTSEAGCAKADLDTVSAGVLTVGTDKPAYPPYFDDDDPTNGKGFESAVAYAVAEQLGFTKDEVKWTVVPFNSSYAPGAEEVRLRHQPGLDHPEARRAGRLLDPYYTAPQAVVALVGLAAATRHVAGRARGREARRPGRHDEPRRRRTRSIKPSKQPQVFNDSNDTVRALKQAGRRDRRRPADRVLPPARGDRRAEDHRPVRRARRRRLGRRAGEGLAS